MPTLRRGATCVVGAVLPPEAGPPPGRRSENGQNDAGLALWAAALGLPREGARRFGCPVGVVGHTGARLLIDLAEANGLSAALSVALAALRQRNAVRIPGYRTCCHPRGSVPPRTREER